MPHYKVTITANFDIKARDEGHAELVAHERLISEAFDSGDLSDILHFEAIKQKEKISNKTKNLS